MGPLFPLTATKEKHIAHAVLEAKDLLFAFTFSRAEAQQGLLQQIQYPCWLGQLSQGTVTSDGT